mmetsp:Transcript_828/g.1234  ORF Transcript_828/g.1234 Transcript_828/m.1234 type:complete len:377 (-) Transcript_828:240-1370(-)
MAFLIKSGNNTRHFGANISSTLYATNKSSFHMFQRRLSLLSITRLPGNRLCKRKTPRAYSLNKTSEQAIRKRTWRKKHLSQVNMSLRDRSVAAETVQPTRKQLRIVALRAAIPMVGFGAMDNFVMLQAGDLIDASLGVTFALSTLTAAGFGQIFSDVAGITCGGAVDALVARLNLPYHNLTLEQLNLRITRVCYTAGGCIGVVIGCLLGMTCLFCMDTEKADRLKKAQELSSVFTTIVDDAYQLVNASRATIWLVDHEKGEIWSRVSTGYKDEIRIASSTGIAGSCVQTGKVIVLDDAYSDPRFHPEVDKLTGFRTRSLITVPIFDEEGGVVGAIQMMNKLKEDGSPGLFDEQDIKLLQLMSSHVGHFLRVAHILP